jgi:hypothetical protein
VVRVPQLSFTQGNPEYIFPAGSERTLREEGEGGDEDVLFTGIIADFGEA